MHDPMVVAFEIRRPWPRIRRSYPDRPRWRLSWSPFWYVPGWELYWPGLITVWHVEPNGADSGDVCKHYRREQQPDGKWKTTILHGWKLHVWHWKIRVGPMQRLRRRLLTRCSWCGGRSRKGAVVNTASGWHTPKTPWWRGEAELYHGECLAVRSAHRSCTCDDPILDHDGWGYCARCNLRRAHGRTDEQTAKLRKLKLVGEGVRPGGAS